jgi:hypothetical protein
MTVIKKMPTLHATLKGPYCDHKSLSDIQLDNFLLKNFTKTAKPNLKLLNTTFSSNVVPPNFLKKKKKKAVCPFTKLGTTNPVTVARSRTPEPSITSL